MKTKNAKQHAGGEFAALAGSGALTWSALKPKRRGWWWREDITGRREVVEVVWIDRKRYISGWGDGDMSCDLDFYQMCNSGKVRWAGPLVGPLEPPDVEPRPNH